MRCGAAGRGVASATHHTSNAEHRNTVPWRCPIDQPSRAVGPLRETPCSSSTARYGRARLGWPAAGLAPPAGPDSKDRPGSAPAREYPAHRRHLTSMLPPPSTRPPRLLSGSGVRTKDRRRGRSGRWSRSAAPQPLSRRPRVIADGRDLRLDDPQQVVEPVWRGVGDGSHDGNARRPSRIRTDHRVCASAIVELSTYLQRPARHSAVEPVSFRYAAKPCSVVANLTDFPPSSGASHDATSSRTAD